MKTETGLENQSHRREMERRGQNKCQNKNEIPLFHVLILHGPSESSIHILQTVEVQKKGGKEENDAEHSARDLRNLYNYVRLLLSMKTKLHKPVSRY